MLFVFLVLALVGSAVSAPVGLLKELPQPKVLDTTTITLLSGAGHTALDASTGVTANGGQVAASLSTATGGAGTLQTLADVGSVRDTVESVASTSSEAQNVDVIETTGLVHGLASTLSGAVTNVDAVVDSEAKTVIKAVDATTSLAPALDTKTVTTPAGVAPSTAATSASLSAEVPKLLSSVGTRVHNVETAIDANEPITLETKLNPTVLSADHHQGHHEHHTDAAADDFVQLTTGIASGVDADSIHVLGTVDTVKSLAATSGQLLDKDSVLGGAAMNARGEVNKLSGLTTDLGQVGNSGLEVIIEPTSLMRDNPSGLGDYFKNYKPAPRTRGGGGGNLLGSLLAPVLNLDIVRPQTVREQMMGVMSGMVNQMSQRFLQMAAQNQMQRQQQQNFFEF
jgi:hypothetical protein